MTPQFIEVVAVLACTLFTGAAVYITAVEHPARLSCGTEIAVAQWAPSYKRATVMQASLALIAGGSGIVRGVEGGGVLWVWAATLILAVVPFTLLVIRPTNTQLFNSLPDRGPNETLELLKRWGRLHVVRSALSVAASILFVWAATR
jgi:Anthrone oxygenase